MQKKLLLLFAVIYFSCEESTPIRDNPFDDESGDYVEPTILLISDISDGDTLYTENVTILWEGNELVSEFRYKLDMFDWTEWSENSEAELNYLDEGSHLVYAQSRYLSGDTSDVVSISFVVDAVDGPSLMFQPRRNFAEVGETVTFQIIAEEVSNLMMSEINIGYDPQALQIISIEQGSFFQDSQSSIFLYEDNPETGLIQVNTTILDGNTSAISGTGSLAIVEVKLIEAVSSTIIFQGTDTFIDPENNVIEISERISGIVEAK